MRKFKKIFLLLALTLGAFAIISVPTTTEAKTHFAYTTTPKTFRGTWVNTAKNDPQLREVLKITKYKYSSKYSDGKKLITSINWSGNKKSHYYNHSDLSVKKGKHGQWKFSQYKMNNDFNPTFKVVKHNGKKALMLIDHYANGKPLNLYYYKR